MTADLNQIILATALVNIIVSNGQIHIARVLLDSGSQVNFITEELSKILDTNLLGIGQSNVSARHVVQATIQSRTQAFQLGAKLIVLKSISSSQPEREGQVLDWTTYS